MAIKKTQQDLAGRGRLRPEYAEGMDALIAVSGVSATNFVAIASAYNYWRG